MADVPNTASKPLPGQPFTFGGLARFAQARWGWLFAVSIFFALLSGFPIAGLLGWRWVPVIRESINNLPPDSAIRAGHLEWPNENGRLLGANSFVSIVVTTLSSEPSAPVDVAIQFETAQLSVRSLLGVAALPYPKNRSFEFNRTTLQPLWGACETLVIPAALLTSAFSLLASWFSLAIPYAFFLQFVSVILRRRLSFGQAWKTGVAAQWPGALLLSFVIVIYAAGKTTLLLLGVTFIAHFLLTWIYLCCVPFFFQPLVANPFSNTGKSSRSRKNPFGDE